MQYTDITEFPFLFGGTFIEGSFPHDSDSLILEFPFLFGGTFIEGAAYGESSLENINISLPFRRDFH